MEKTWFHCLSEAGKPVINAANDILKRYNRIEALRAQIILEQKEIDEMEKELTALVETEWSDADILKAKQDSLE